jgi:hypothetical protein
VIEALTELEADVRYNPEQTAGFFAGNFQEVFNSIREGLNS